MKCTNENCQKVIWHAGRGCSACDLCKEYKQLKQIEEKKGMIKGMKEWKCPHCCKKMYSSWDQKDKETMKCIYCGKEFKNPFYKKIVE
jgi:hypothetical protein